MTHLKLNFVASTEKLRHRGWGSVFFFSWEYLIVLAAAIENNFTSPLNHFGTFIENYLTVYLWVIKTFDPQGKMDALFPRTE